MGRKHRLTLREGLYLLRDLEWEALGKARRHRHVHPSMVVALAQRLGQCRAYVASEVDWQGAYQEACDAIERLLVDTQHTIERNRAARKAAQEEAKRDVAALRAELDRVRAERDDALQQARDGFARGMRLGREKAEAAS